MAAAVLHPYHPPSLELQGYQDLVVPFERILAIFFSACGLVLALGWGLTGRAKFLSTPERAMACWFLCSGLIHLIVEGNVVLNARFFQDTSGNLLNEIWKEYSKADSRYASRDDFIISHACLPRGPPASQRAALAAAAAPAPAAAWHCPGCSREGRDALGLARCCLTRCLLRSMEAVTAFLEGPGCLAIVYAMLRERPWRFAAILAVSLGQLYGDVLYFGTCLHGGIARHSRPEWIYFWFYFVIVNGVWIVVPSACIAYAARRINAAVAGFEQGSPPKRE